ncbi:tyrosine-type recombinase/integrase [Actinomadura geliboluensis]|uniref:Site-specific integrase n=1 Tax=Actinomadura geliboluensis TaxID=882440 RepID=A0A5S4FTU4_9ACTN|nr:site-specific integrase [Actinomadura geliboluensis]TMR23804.1 site-specific integrase [Actinomadura geliboluensis]
MPAGTTYKACGCRTPDGRGLLSKCPKLRRRGGSWSPTHGSWYYQFELPPRRDGTRRSPIRRGGFTSQDAAETQIARLHELLAISTDAEDRSRIADLITTTLKKDKRLPAPEEVRRKIRTGQDLDTAITVGQWLQTWLAGRKGLRNGTLRSYRTHITTHLNPVIGDIRLDRLRVADVQAVFDAIDERNEAITRARESGDPEARAQVKGARAVGPATMHRIRATLRAALNQAIRERRIDLNVASLIELPSGRRPKALVWTPERVREWRRGRETFIEAKSRICPAGPDGKVRNGRVKPMDAYVSTPRPSPVMVWTPEQTGTFLDRAALHRLHALYHLIAFRGLRRGEACGLRWADVDLDEGTIRVRWQITQNGGHTEQGRPKSEAGERQVTLDQHTVKQLTAHRARQNQERLAAGGTWNDTGFVFTQPDGSPLAPMAVSEQFLLLAMETGLPPVRLHDLRHGAATILLRAGHDLKVVQETLGLSSITIASDTYTSVLPDLARQSAEDAAAVILNARTGPEPDETTAAGRVVHLVGTSNR